MALPEDERLGRDRIVRDRPEHVVPDRADRIVPDRVVSERVPDRVVSDRVVVPPVQYSVRWPGVWAGLLIAMGVLVILTALGIAVGVTTATNNTAELGTAAAWWGGISFLIALFIGGAVAARWVVGGLTSVLQGALVWTLAMVGVFYLAGAGISLGAQGLFSALNSPALNGALQQMASSANQVTSQVGTSGTANAVHSAAPAAWITFIVLVVSALAAIIGALVGHQKDVRTI